MPEPIYHHTLIDEQDVTWTVDRRAAASVMPWIKRRPKAFERDLSGMAAYFPQWLLVGGVQGKLARCPTCRTFCVPTEGAIRCLNCWQAQAATGLIWLGQIPALARAEAAFTPRQMALRQAGFGEVTTGGATYLLAPLTVHYPAEWPNVEPPIFYARRWLQALGLPEGSGSHHLLAGGRACIFSWNQWQAMPVHAVLQQRLVNHIASLLKIAAGMSPAEAFIGRIHHQPWQPEG